jgi:hypothetical protein
MVIKYKLILIIFSIYNLRLKALNLIIYIEVYLEQQILLLNKESKIQKYILRCLVLSLINIEKDLLLNNLHL